MNFYGESVVGANATFYHTKSDIIVVSGISKFEELYTLKGEDGYKSMVYLSEKPDGTSNWNLTEKIILNNGEKNHPRTIVIKIKEKDFLYFFVKKGLSPRNFICDDGKGSKGCGCDKQSCKNKRNSIRIEDFKFDRENETLTLDLFANFNYTKIYHFQMNLDSKFKSMLTLEFDITTVYDTLNINTTANPGNLLIQVPPLCTKILNNGKNSTNFLVDETTLANVKDVYDLEIENAEKNQINFKFGPKFNYARTYELKCSGNLSHSKMAFKFDIKKEMTTASLGVGIASTFALIVVGGVIVVAKKRKLSQEKTQEKKLEAQQTIEEPLIDEDPLVDVCDRKFPKSTVKAWKDITLEKELGSGQFGKVYQGFLHLGPTR